MSKEVRPKEVRYVAAAELRAEGEGDARRLVGYAAMFNKRSLPMPLGWDESFVEVIKPGAFAGVLGNDVRALINHDSNLVLGRNKAGTLKLSEDEIGLRVEITPPDTSYANDLIASIKRGDVDQMSFAFVVGEEKWGDGEDGIALREILSVAELFDVSPVTYPAYPDTTVAARHLEQLRAEQKPETPEEPEPSEPDPDRARLQRLAEIQLDPPTVSMVE